MPHVLVVDDDWAVSATIKLILERDGYTVTVATDGHLALDQLATTDHDLVILDIFMPMMDGFELIGAIRRHRRDLPILVISGTGSRHGTSAPDFLAMATKLGASRSLGKPFSARDLLNAVNACLAVRTGVRESA